VAEVAIICVDDEPAILIALKDQLQRSFGNKYIYEIAQSASEALAVLDELEEDEIKVLIIVSDWLMPNMNGDEFLIQVHQRFPEIVTIMLTGQAEEAAINRARQQANLYACIAKPWAEEDLQRIISTALS
jgi:CheY-like chemotaxis protein